MKYIFKTLLAVTLIFFAACEEKIHELSLDPDDVIRANDSEVLTSAQGWLAIIQDVDLNESPSFLWAQYYTWGIGVSIGNVERYVAEPDDYNGYWRRAYSDALIDLKYLSNSESAAYRAVSQILTVYGFQALVDHFGDVPYTEALRGEIVDGAILTPRFDDAATIYADLVTQLDNALDELALARTLGQDGDIGTDDLIYAGDLNKWAKFANSLKLRILLRTSEVAPNGAAIQALIASGSFLEDGDLAEVQWSGVIGNENPMYATELSGVGDFYFASSATTDVLDALNDPRKALFYGPATSGPETGNVRSICQGCVDRDVPFTDASSDYAGSSPYANGPAVSTIFMSPWEVWFLRAEAAARYNTNDDAATAFANAVQLNFTHVGAGSATSYLTALNYAGASTLDARLDMIATQAWIAFNGTQEDEGWMVTRRFDRPASRLFSQGYFQTPPLSVLPPNTHPATWLYPESERAFNPNAAPQRKITDKIFWDN